MGLNVGEATAANRLIDFICDRPGPAGPVSRAQALEAANLLARASAKRLMAGYSGNGDVDRVWPDGMRVVIEIPAEERLVETLEEVLRLVGEDFTSGIGPNWRIEYSE